MSDFLNALPKVEINLNSAFFDFEKTLHNRFKSMKSHNSLSVLLGMAMGTHWLELMTADKPTDTPASLANLLARCAALVESKWRPSANFPYSKRDLRAAWDELDGLTQEQVITKATLALAIVQQALGAKSGQVH